MQNQKKKVLLIEDDSEIAELWILMLSSRGHEVIWAKNVEDAIRVYDEQGPWDFIVLDGELEDGGSFEPVIDHIRITRSNILTPVFPTSGKTSIRLEQIARGCLAYHGEKSHSIFEIERALAA